MNIELTERESNGHFAAIDGNKEAGRLSFSLPAENQMIIESTRVSKEFEGRGIGKNLVVAAVEYARKNKLTVIPSCPFARKVIDRDESLQDVLDIQVP